LHLGHAYSAWVARARAREAGGFFRLRLEDIDGGRCRAEFAAAALEDLAWLGLDWDGAVRVQSAHLAEYRAALGRLDAMGLLYPCFCTRAEIAAQAAPHGDLERYPGTCRGLAAAERQALMGEKPYALRLDVAEAVRQAGPLRFFEEQKGWVEVDAARFGDGVLARKDTPTSYHLCVVHDDALQGVTHVTRGEDLAGVTHVHVLLQRLLGVGTPVYAHHPLLKDADGKRLAKRDKAATLRAMREAGVAPADVLLRLRGFAATHIADV
jgi:glutamyl-Q tRNA(Asp) synthetase